MKRRQFLNAAGALAVGSQVVTTQANAQEGKVPPDGKSNDVRKAFGFEDVRELAKERATRVYKQPVAEQVGSFANINYDQYRAIRFRKDKDPLHATDNFALDLLPPGVIFYEPVNINIVRDGIPQKMGFDPHLLEFDPSQFPDGADLETKGEMGWSGFRLRTPLNKPGVMDEFLVFQGASYYRAVARGTVYGLSARGLAIKVGSPDGEEFPLFTDFWVHEPHSNDQDIRIHALLDSKSLTAAYEFDVTPGAVTMIKTRLSIYPRIDLRETGIAPLTSMFWFSPASRRQVDDYRVAVHDSDGLQMHTGADQALWRSLTSSKELQISSFVDNNPRGFGLIQRNRSFDDYQDAEALYHARPSTWIEPIDNWGEGEVRLVEIPVEDEFNDNIVSFWVPKEPLEKDKRHDFQYRQSFASLPPSDLPLARVRQVRSGRSINNDTYRTYIVDFDLDFFNSELPESKVSTSSGKIIHAYLKPLPDQNVLRLAFEFEPGDAKAAELQAVLTNKDGLALSETWMTRWNTA